MGALAGPAMRRPWQGHLTRLTNMITFTNMLLSGDPWQGHLKGLGVPEARSTGRVQAAQAWLACASRAGDSSGTTLSGRGLIQSGGGCDSDGSGCGSDGSGCESDGSGGSIGSATTHWQKQGHQSVMASKTSQLDLVTAWISSQRDPRSHDIQDVTARSRSRHSLDLVTARSKIS